MRNEFADISQNEDESVSDYQIRFNYLSHFDRDAIPTEQRKCEKFEKSLKLIYKQRIVPMDINKFDQIIRTAMIMEDEGERI
ncbi:hypothetical protein, partial [Bartonella sp. AC134YNZD]|uniref:hypothetical protein n=1 Tax=Bartonella sp. AC134YNZD TaxID=3243446 RepID=UPI0035CF5FBF